MLFKSRFSLISSVLAGALLAGCASGGEGRSGEGPQVVGEEIEVSLSSPAFAPAADARESVVVWEEEISFSDATYIALHFNKFSLPEGAELVVRTPDHSRRATYVLDGKDVPGSDGFWALYMPGDTAVLELTSSAPLRAGVVSIDRFARGLPAWDDLGNSISDNISGGDFDTEAICGADESEEAKCYETSEPAAYNEARAVARLMINGSGACTGWLVGSDGHLMTNEHCIGNASDAANTEFEFMSEGATCATDCKSWGACKNGETISGSTVVKINASLDYALVKLPSNPTGNYGYMQLRDGPAVTGERIYIPQHPAAWGKRIAMLAGGADAVVTGTVSACTSGAPVPDVGYMADTQGGSSGSPVLSYDDNTVIALHHCANCPNRGVPIDAIIADLGGLVPPDAIGGGGGGDTEAPTASLTSPANGATVSGTVTVSADASDNTGVTSVEFFVNGSSIGSDTTAPYSVSWNTAGAGNGSNTVSATARDAAGNSGSDSVTVTVENTGGGNLAIYDPALGTAACKGDTSSCDSGSLFTGRGTMSGGAESNASNTVDGCADGNSGTFHSDESGDGIRVFTNSGNDFAGGESVTVEADVWAWSTGSSDKADIFYATDANNPSWTLVNTLSPTAGGAQTLSTSFTLQEGASLQAIRVQWRYQSDATACASGSYNDRDDLVIKVAGGGGGPTPGDGRASFDASRGAPACTGAAGSCDSLDLLTGRGTMSGGAESNGSNTIDGCADGNSGTFHSDESSDRLVVSTASGDLRAGASVTVEATVWAWNTGSADNLDVFYASNADSPSWTLIGTVSAAGGGEQVLSTSFNLASTGGNHAVRAQWRYNSSATACSSGGYNDRDDLVFEVQ